MAVFVIEHPDGGKWYTQWGWVPQAEAALRFANHGEAQGTTETVMQARGGVVKAIEMAEDARGNRLHATQTDYNPFGLPRV